VDDLELCVTWPQFVLDTCGTSDKFFWTFDAASAQMRAGIGAGATSQCVTTNGAELALKPCQEVEPSTHVEFTDFNP